MSTWVAGLGDLSRTDIPRAGGKGANLGELMKAGMPVPDGFCVTADAYREHIARNNLHPALTRCLSGMNPDDVDSVARAGAEIRGLITTAPIPDEIAQEIVRCYGALGGDAAVAVRSSATAEDLPDASFAGQQDTYLDVRGERDVVESVKACWASLWTDRAISYRQKHQFDHTAVALACVVQRMVPADLAGVMFTADPVTGERDRVVVNSVPGLGEALVSGKATADQFVLRKDDAHVVTERLAEPGRPRPDLAALVELARRIERHFGAPQDIEWATSGGRIYALQSRPITNLREAPVHPDDATRPLYAYTVKLEEMMPSALTPLGADAFEKVFFPMIFRGLTLHGLAPRHLLAQINRLAQAIRGRVYLNATFIREFLMPGLDEVALVDALEHGKRPPLSALRWKALLPLMLAGPFAAAKVLRFLLDVDKHMAALVEAHDRHVAPWERADLSGRSWDEVLKLVDASIWDEKALHQLLAPVNAFSAGLAAPFYTALGHILSRWAGEPAESAGVLVSGLSGIAEVECAAMLWDLATEARKVPEVVEALERKPDDALRILEDKPAASGWIRQFRAFQERFGHRGIEEVELARPKWREDPAYPLTVIANYLRADPSSDPREVERRQRERRLALEERIRQRLRYRPIRRRIFDVLLHVSQKTAVARQNSKAEIMRSVGVFRAGALELGRRLVAQGRTDRVDDVFFLLLTELRALPDGDLRELVAQRRRAYANWQRERPARFLDAQSRPLQLVAQTVVTTGEGALCGVGSSPGKATGVARIIRDPTTARLNPGEILVAPFTDPSWTPLFLCARAVVVEVGSLLSHASIVARELGIPSVVALPGATERLKDGDVIEVDGQTGVVRVVQPAGSQQLAA
ncbi:MAG: PEP/pyruvate-binding domain-containing protein [Myxococcota bacterium]